MRRILLSILFQIMAVITFSQPLMVGDKIPEITLHDVLYYKADTLRLSDLKGKLIILDFWSTGCMSCIKHFPEIDSIQKNFGDRVQYLLVSRQNKKQIQTFFETKTRIVRPSVPFITGDILLEKYFPHRAMPFFVWINEESKVQHLLFGQTGYLQIKNYLSGIKNNLREYIIPRIENSPLTNSWNSLTAYYSFLSRCADTLQLRDPPGKQFSSLTYNCTSVLSLYEYAYNMFYNMGYEFHRPGRLLAEGEDADKFLEPKEKEEREKWYETSTYTYQLIIDKSKEDKLYSLMIQDLDRMFGLKAAIEKRTVTCLTLVRTSKKDKLKTKGGDKKDNFLASNIKTPKFDSTRILINSPFSILSTRLKANIESDLRIPFMDITGYTGNIDISVNGLALDPFDLELLKMELNKYDLDLIWKDFILDVLVIKTKKMPGLLN